MEHEPFYNLRRLIDLGVKLTLTLEQCREILFSDPVDIQQIYNNLSSIIFTLKENIGKNKTLRFNNDGTNEEWERLGSIVISPGVDSKISEQVFLNWYETILDYQEENPRGRVHKGLPLHNLGWSYWKRGKYNLGKKYIQLALIEDILSHSTTWKDNQAYRFLSNLYGIPVIELDFFASIVESKRRTPGRFYPESILLEFLLQKDSDITRDFERDIFHVNLQYVKKLLDKVNSGQKNSWKYLEILSAYLLSNIDGFEVVGKNLGTADYEIDVLIKNSITEDPTFASFGKYILVECKNWKNPVNVTQVNHFLSKIRFHYASCGILISRKGVSGRTAKRARNAELTILKAFHQDNIILMILTLDDLKKVSEGQNLASILIREYERIKFDRTTR